MIKPNDAVLRMFNSIVNAWFEKKLELESTTTTLANLRDSLLPKLLSGQLSIPGAEQALDEVS